DYWGEVEFWDNVKIRIIANGAARVAALLSGGVDIITDVPPGDVETLKGNADLKIWTSASNRLFYLRPNGAQEAVDAGLISSRDGSPLDKNPLADPKVRLALSVAVNREAITSRIYQGLAVPTTQYMREGNFGYMPDWPADIYDADRARSLLAEAGYPD